MRVEVAEKGEGFVMLKCIAQSGAEGMILGSISQGVDDAVSLQLDSRPWDSSAKESVIVGQVRIPVIEMLRKERK